MLRFSRDPEVSERQMQALLFSLVAFGYIDGDFDQVERRFIEGHLRKLVAAQIEEGYPEATAAVLEELIAQRHEHFLETLEAIDVHIRELFNEVLAEEDSRRDFVASRLKLRCFELFKGFDHPNQLALLAAVDEVIAADGVLHPAEATFRAELVALLEAKETGILTGQHEEDEVPHTAIVDPITLPLAREDHPFFRQFEHHYSKNKKRLLRQVRADLELAISVRRRWQDQRTIGEGHLDGKQSVAEIPRGERFLDNFTLVHRPHRGERHELFVLGDLHGCYSCLKGALMQASFFRKVTAYQKDPDSHPRPMLVLLGDYIDRGIFSLNGVLRAAMQIFERVPEHVVLLRGNHEYYVEHDGEIQGGVRPAEAINTLKPHLPVDVFRQYMQLFESMPTSFLFDRILFVHAGIPRDQLLRERWEGLRSFNDPYVRFQMMWSDPSAAARIPEELQNQSARFPFGRLQFRAFMQRIGCTLMVRGHERVLEGFQKVYPDEDRTLLTVFSAGGAENDDLPKRSGYRRVKPKALRIRYDDGAVSVEPFAIDYKAYNDPNRNAFFRSPPELNHIVE